MRHMRDVDGWERLRAGGVPLKCGARTPEKPRPSMDMLETSRGFLNAKHLVRRNLLTSALSPTEGRDKRMPPIPARPPKPVPEAKP